MENSYVDGVFPDHLPVPRPIRRAARLMYVAGWLTAAATLIEVTLTTVFNLLSQPAATTSSIPRSELPPGVSAASFHPAGTFVGVVVPTIVVGLVMLAVGLGVSAAWFRLGAKCKAGRGWARTVCTVLFGVYTFWVLALVVSMGAASHVWPFLLYLLVLWLLGLAVTVLLWQRQSSAFFRASQR